MHKTLRNVAHKAVCGVSALALVAGMSAFPLGGSSQAVADEGSLTAAGLQAQEVTAVNTDTAIRAAAYRAGEPAPEILGLSGVGTNTAWQDVGELDWSAPYYYLFGTSEYNSNPNPFMVNAVYNTANKLSAGDAGYKSPTMVFYSRQGGPTAAMYQYGSGHEDSDEAWKLLPQVILGTGNGVDYSDSDYAPKVAEAVGVTNYNPQGVAYDTTNIYTMIDSMYDLAAAADAADAASDTTSLRYGNATAIAQDYERYVRGTFGYVLSQLAKDGKQKKTVALVNNYDAASQTYTLAKTGVAEGTAASNRYLEAVQPVATNIADSLETTTINRSDLAKVDLIMLGSQAGQENIASTEDILNSFTSDMQQKTYWVNSTNGSAGSTYGVVMNSVENAQNIGRILGCLYSEYVDQDDWVTYYYDTFYHLNTGKLAEAVDKAMDGVRNWDATSGSTYSSLTLWTEDDASTYKKTDVEAKLNAGLTYLGSSANGDIPTYLPVTDNLSTAYFSSIDSQSYTGGAITPAFSMKRVADGADVLVVDANGNITTGADSYNVSYSNNVNAGTASISVSSKNESDFFVASTQFSIEAATSSESLSFDDIEGTFQFDGNAIEPTVKNVKLGSTTLGSGQYTVSYSNNTHAGTGVVTVKAVNFVSESKEPIAASRNFTILPADDQAFILTLHKTFGDGPFSFAASTKYVDSTTSGRATTINSKISYQSTNENVASVLNEDVKDASGNVTNEAGEITIKGAGTTYLIIKAKGTDSVNEAVVTIRLVVDPAAQTVTGSNTTKTYGATAFSPFAHSKGDGAMTYKSSKTSVATIDTNGKVTIKGAGTATLTATAAATDNYAAATKSITLTVNKAAQTITASNVTKTFGAAGFSPFTRSVGNGAMTYTSSNTSVATIDKNTGKVTIKKAGTAKLTATAAATTNYASATKSITLTVGQAANTLKVAAKSATLSASAKSGKTFTAAQAWKVSTNKSGGALTYTKTSGDSHITIASNGKVTVKKGLTKGKTYTVKVKVVSKATTNYKSATLTNVALKIKAS